MGLSICPFVHPSQLLFFFSLLSFLSSICILFLLLLPPRSLASSASLPFPPALGAHSENTTQAQPCLAHTRYHGMALLPAQGKPGAWPAPHSPPSPWKDLLAIWGFSPPVPILLGLPICLPILRGSFWEAGWMGYPWSVVRGGWRILAA